MTAWDDKWATPQAQAYAKADQRRALADEIARAAVDVAHHPIGYQSAVAPRGAEWAWMHRDRWAWACAYARGYLDARRP